MENGLSKVSIGISIIAALLAGGSVYFAHETSETAEAQRQQLLNLTGFDFRIRDDTLTIFQISGSVPIQLPRVELLPVFAEPDQQGTLRPIFGRSVILPLADPRRDGSLINYTIPKIKSRLCDKQIEDHFNNTCEQSTISMIYVAYKVEDAPHYAVVGIE